MTNELKKTFENAPVVPMGDYDYVVHPITDGISRVEPKMLEKFVEEMVKYTKEFREFDIIVTAEAMGIPVATALSLRLRKPFNIIRKRKYNLPGEAAVHQETGYSKSNLYINGLKKGDRILFVDDMLSTGGTLRETLRTLKRLGVVISGIIMAVEKGEGGMRKSIEKEFDVEIRSVVNI